MRGGARTAGAVVLVIALTLATAPLTAQEYSVFGSVEITGTSAHQRDSAVVLDPSERDTWYAQSDVRLAATHRLGFSTAEMVVDHAITARPTGQGAASAGSKGVGAADATEVALTHDLYQGYLYLYPAAWVSLSFGRQRLNWGKAYSYSVTDALHPQSPDSEVEPGFDGASVAFLIGSNVSLEFAGAVQDAVSTGDNRDTRGAVYLSAYAAPFDLAASFVYQPDTIYRPGVLASVPIGPVLIAGEAALEAYDPRAQEIDYQPIGSIGAEYSLYGTLNELTLVAEYVYNGLADNNPFNTGATRMIVTSDFAGGFERPGEHYVYGSASFSRLDSWSTSHSVIYNASDQSAFVEHRLDLVSIPSVDIGAGVLWTSGELDSEFGLVAEDFTIELTTKVSF
jgi:hypothetical protein